MIKDELEIVEVFDRFSICKKIIIKQRNALQPIQFIKTTKTVLNEAIEKNGTSISDYRRIDDKKGEFQNFLQIYQKTTCPKGHPVQKIKQGGRSTYFCPVCQK